MRFSARHLACAVACAVVVAAFVPARSHAQPVEEKTTARGGCTTCHAEIAREWASSAHRRSATDPMYERALAREDLAFCRRCHAPGANSSWPTPEAARARGIDCLDCHAGLDGAHSEKTAARHPARACASCHEFAFPDGTPGMQRTQSEHAKSASSGVACSQCHMQDVAGARPHRDHRFALDNKMIASALVADVRRSSSRAVAFRLQPGKVGHAFPTGDLFRRLIVQVEALDEHDVPVSRVGRYLARHFAQKPGQSGMIGRIDAKDDRVGVNLEPCFELDVGSRGEGRRFKIEIALERVEHPNGAREDDAVVGSRVVVFERVIDPQSSAENASCKQR